MNDHKWFENQSSIKIDRWIDITSPEANEFCPEINKMIIKILENPQPGDSLITDNLGRIWGKGDNGYYPLHDEFCGEKIGYRMVKKASN
jgi:hypothetical protein